LRRLRADPVLAVFACRSTSPDGLPPGLLRLADQQDNHLRLEGLTDDDVRALALARDRGELPSRAVARLRRHTGGNPLHLGALFTELRPAELSAETELPAPSSYAALVVRTLGSRDEAAQCLARAAAVLRNGCPLDLAARLAGIDGPGAPEQALEELTDTGLWTCRYDEDAWRMSFSHPLTRAAVYDAIGPAERVRLHRRAAELLYGDDALRHRVSAASGPDAELARDLARAAESRRSNGDLHGAADLLRAAARLNPAASTEPLLEATTLFLISGDVPSAKALDPLLASLPPGGRRFYLQAKIAWFTGQPSQAEALATQAWEQADDLDRLGRGSLAGILAQLCNMRGAGLEAAAWAERALGHELQDDLEDSTTAARAVGLAQSGLVAEALDVLAPLDADPTAVPPEQHHRLAARGALRAAQDDLAGARADLAHVAGAAVDTVAPYRLVAMGVLAEVDYRLGRWSSSAAVAEQARSLAEDSEQRWLLGYLNAVAVLVSAGRGDWDLAGAHLDEGRRIGEALGDPVSWAVCENAAVHLAWCRGRPAEVVDRAALLRSLDGGPTHEPGLLGWPVLSASALVELGRLDEAEAEVERFAAVATERGSRSRQAGLARVRGELHTARRGHRAARDAFEEALSVGGRAADALEQAMVRLSFGRFLRRRGERRKATLQLQDARQRFLVLGAAPFVERCDEELAACGEHPAAATAPVTARLTPQEQIVARLVCQGLTNQEVAHQLVLSVKTIDYHLGNVYAKLAVHSRTQLVNVLGSAG
jgi:DNA-binding CsgD family transcriptional regulator